MKARRLSAPPRRNRRWAIAGALLGAVVATVLFAPAAWMASGIAAATQQRVLLADSRGSLWDGSARLILSPGVGSRDAIELSERLGWTLRPAWIDGGLGIRLALQQACCIRPDAAMSIRPGWGRVSVRLPDATPDRPWIRLPAGWLVGLGTPWNTLMPGGQLVLSTQGFAIDAAGGRVQLQGVAQMELRDFTSRLSPVAPLGSYRLNVLGAGNSAQLVLQTERGPLRLTGQGSLGARFLGEATAEPGHEAALANLLNIIGRREGARSIISVG